MRWFARLIFAVLAFLAAPAWPDRRPDPPVFAGVPVSDVALTALRGGESPFAPLTRANATRLVDDVTRADLRHVGGVGRVEMDVWWGTIGSELIAQNVRAADRP